MQVRVSERLRRIASFVPANARIVDVGTDHALLPILLVQLGRIHFAVATDVALGPYRIARRNVEKYGLANTINVRLGDGLSTVTAGDIDTVVIAGMGGDTIVSILDDAPDVLASAKRLILQPMTHPASVREYLRTHEFGLTREDLVPDGRHFYHLVEASRVDDSDAAYAPFLHDDVWLHMALEFGPLLLACPTPAYVDYIRATVDAWNHIAKAMSEGQGKSVARDLEAFTIRLRYLEAWLGRHEMTNQRT